MLKIHCILYLYTSYGQYIYLSVTVCAFYNIMCCVCVSVCVCVCVCSAHRTVSVWDGKDGACLKYTVISGHHSGIKVRTYIVAIYIYIYMYS